jgi:anti-sigma-K factor RskA
MTPSQDEPHREWEELAAGHVLDALEPDEEARFSDHLAGCAHCQKVTDEHAHVAAQLGALAHDDGLAAPSWAAIRDGVVTAPQPDAPAELAPVLALRSGPPRWATRVLAAAAALALIAGGVTAVVLHGGSGSTSPAVAAIKACTPSTACHVIRLQQEQTERAVVLVRDNAAQVVSTGLTAPPHGLVYVLWQMPREGRPVLVSALPGMQVDRPTSSSALTLPYADTAAFAISQEPANVVPLHPTTVLAVGAANA